MIAVCLKWVGTGGAEDRLAGLSPADQAALEWALRCRDQWNLPVVALTAGPVGAEAVLRDALAAGADRAVRVDVPVGAPSSDVADALARHVTDASVVWCGDYSADRGTGSVPAFLAGALTAAQALGLVDVQLGAAGQPDQLQVVRRLDAGRREILRVASPAVLSVEGSTARLRRASLKSLLAPGVITIVASGLPASQGHDTAGRSVRTYRPRARVLPSPVGATALHRMMALTEVGETHSSGETVHLAPQAAADRILAALTEWGYLP